MLDIILFLSDWYSERQAWFSDFFGILKLFQAFFFSNSDKKRKPFCKDYALFNCVKAKRG
jgi:hypothetical protein